MNVRYTLDALAHISSIHEYIKQRNSLAAGRVAARIRKAADSWAISPYGADPGLSPARGNGL